MDGYGLEVGELTALSGQFSEIGEVLGKVGTDFGGAVGGDFGHESINAAVQQVVGGLQRDFGMLSQHANGMGQNLISTRDQYFQLDETSASTFTSIGDAEAGAAAEPTDSQLPVNAVRYDPSIGL